MNQREWSTANDKVTLTATSNVTTVSSYEWAARFGFEIEYPEVPTISEQTVEDGAYRLFSSLDQLFMSSRQ